MRTRYDHFTENSVRIPETDFHVRLKIFSFLNSDNVFNLFLLLKTNR